MTAPTPALTALLNELDVDESWRPVVGFEGLYEVSDCGRIRSLDRTVNRNGVLCLIRGTLRASRLDAEGRPKLELYRDGTVTTARVHRLVLNAFVGARPDGMEGCHNDGDPTNNHLSNLRWDTQSENQRDSVRHGTHVNTRKSHCINGHPLDSENLIAFIRDGRPRRECRTCAARRKRALRAYEAERVPCPECLRVIRRDSLPRHARSFHPTAALEAES